MPSTNNLSINVYDVRTGNRQRQWQMIFNGKLSLFFYGDNDNVDNRPRCSYGFIFTIDLTIKVQKTLLLDADKKNE
ncbi:hypothetical protein DERP_014106 [Dermatophagoides pteronyssinus]|uniref:Uncharacterized protein n=1 Tax=Dermatophagoides pteronyssinus TaxID=6956 RepID=A0ABQ8IXA1_DERPT|nr:hypothetical protein DERP_014106 [Dermatophagoides pteronyssinus]